MTQLPKVRFGPLPTSIEAPPIPRESIWVEVVNSGAFEPHPAFLCPRQLDQLHSLLQI
jgi:hypothetical protein